MSLFSQAPPIPWISPVDGPEGMRKADGTSWAARVPLHNPPLPDRPNLDSAPIMPLCACAEKARLPTQPRDPALQNRQWQWDLFTQPPQDIGQGSVLCTTATGYMYSFNRYGPPEHATEDMVRDWRARLNCKKGVLQKACIEVQRHQWCLYFHVDFGIPSHAFFDLRRFTNDPVGRRVAYEARQAATAAIGEAWKHDSHFPCCPGRALTSEAQQASLYADFDSVHRALFIKAWVNSC